MSIVQAFALRIAGALGFSVAPARKGGLPVDFSDAEIDEIRAVKPFTLTSPERIQALLAATRYVVQADIPGEIVECGVWLGGSMMAVARTLGRMGESSRNLYLFDTFEGMTAATAKDRDYRGKDAAQMMARAPGTADDVWAIGPLETVRKNMTSTGYPSERIHYKVGRVEDTLPREAPDQIALLRLDTDWYESTRHELETLFPRLVPGGVLIIDDYGHWEGAKRAVDEYIQSHDVKILLNRIDYTGRIGIKR
jgi:predicted O-methyltransferase YrrM